MAMGPGTIKAIKHGGGYILEHIPRETNNMAKFSMAALEKILGKGKSGLSAVGHELGGAGKGMGSVLGAAGKDVGHAVSDLRTGGKFSDVARSVGDSAKYGMKELGNVAKKHPYGTAALGVGAGAAAGGAGLGIHELLAQLEDEDDQPKRRR